MVDENGTGVANAQIYIDRPALGTQSRTDGGYTLSRVPPGTYTLHARLLGFKPESTSVTVSARRPDHRRTSPCGTIRFNCKPWS